MIARQDALARRTAKAIEDFLDTHIPGNVAHAETAHARRVLLERFERIPRELAPAIAVERDPNAVFRLLDAELRRGLNDVAEALEAAPPIRHVPDPLLQRPGRLRPSSNLASARARVARLHAQRMDLLGRCWKVSTTR